MLNIEFSKRVKSARTSKRIIIILECLKFEPVLRTQVWHRRDINFNNKTNVTSRLIAYHVKREREGERRGNVNSYKRKGFMMIFHYTLFTRLNYRSR